MAPTEGMPLPYSTGHLLHLGFLKGLSQFWAQAMLPSGLPDEIADDEDLARFITSSSQFNSLMAKPAAFLPNPKHKNTSVFRHVPDWHGLKSLWDAVSSSERSLHAVAVFRAEAVRAAQLDVCPEEPPERHANIVGWPWLPQDPELQKARQKE
jgi:hypothetical protein